MDSVKCYKENEEGRIQRFQSVQSSKTCLERKPLSRDLNKERGAVWLRWWYGRGVVLGKDNNFPEYLSCTRPYSRGPGESNEQYC